MLLFNGYKLGDSNIEDIKKIIQNVYVSCQDNSICVGQYAVTNF